jgi:cobalt-zinc-cadmium efflux system protein
MVAIFIFYEALTRFITPSEVHSVQMLIVACIGLGANLISMTVMSRRMLSLNIKAAFLHVLSDALSSLGVIIGAIIIYFTNLFIIDAIIGVIIGVIIIFGTSRMLRTIIHILLEGTPKHIDPEKIIEKIKKIEGIIDVHDLHVWSITSYVHLLSAHLVLKEGMGNHNQLLNNVKVILQRDYGISHSTLQLETKGYKEIGKICHI